MFLFLIVLLWKTASDKDILVGENPFLAGLVTVSVFRPQVEFREYPSHLNISVHLNGV